VVCLIKSGVRVKRQENLRIFLQIIMLDIFSGPEGV
jgi:hypothetical protein